MIVSPDCRDGNYQKCNGTAWDEAGDEPTVCQHPSHHPAFLPVEVELAHIIADAKDKYAQVDPNGTNNIDLLAGRAIAQRIGRATMKVLLEETEQKGTDA